MTLLSYECMVMISSRSVRFKYLGVLLDHQLNFSLHVDYAIAKAKQSAARFVLCLMVEMDFLYSWGCSYISPWCDRI